MKNNERKPGESVLQWRDRVKLQKRMDKVTSGKDYGGEIEPAIVVAEKKPTFKQNIQNMFTVKLPEMVRAEHYSPSKVSFDKAYQDARSKGQKTFFYGKDYFNTDYKGSHGKQYEQDLKSGKVAWWERQYPNFTYPELRKEKEEELATYGIVDEQTKNKSIKDRLLKKIPARGYDVSNAISAIRNEHNSLKKYNSPEEALAAIHSKYGNKFLDAPIPTSDTTSNESWRFSAYYPEEYEKSISEEDRQLWNAFKTDINSYTSSNNEWHRGEYDLLLGYPIQKDAEIKPTISKYRTGTLPYYYTTSALEDSNPYNTSYVDKKIEERLAQEQKWDSQVDSLKSLLPKWNSKLSTAQNYEIANSPEVQDIWSQIDSVGQQSSKLYNEFQNKWYTDPDFNKYWTDRGVKFNMGDSDIDQSLVRKNASKNDIDVLFNNGIITSLDNSWLETIEPGNHLADSGGADYYMYTEGDHSLSDVMPGKYDNAIKKVLSIINKMRGGDVGGENRPNARNTQGVLNTDFLGNYTLGVPSDRTFTSVYDKFDVDPFGMGGDKPIVSVGKPFEYYTRFYPEGKTPNIDSLYIDFNKNWPK